MRRFGRRTVLVALFQALSAMAAAEAEVLEVGEGRRFVRVEEACARAKQGDVVAVWPLPGGAAYEGTAVMVRRPGLTFRGMAPRGRRVPLSGKGFDFSGEGAVPRAIFQFDPGADDGLVEGFELAGAHNASHNGAGVRVNQADRVTIRNCEIRNNDMGVMSNGDGTLGRMKGLLVEGCVVHHNGDFTDPGYNHNFYLGGASALIRSCEIHSALTGHNVKSRASRLRVEYCFVHASANREFDLVDAAETELPGSHAVLIGNVIVKDPEGKGNRGVLHFGQDGGRDHDGTLYLIHNTIVTPFKSPVVDLSAQKAAVEFYGNLLYDGGDGDSQQSLVALRAGASQERVSGRRNWMSRALAKAAEGFPGIVETVPGPARFRIAFRAPEKGDYSLAAPVQGITGAGPPLDKLPIPALPGEEERPKGPRWQYLHPASSEKRPQKGKPDLGACEGRKG